jgi:MFS family permease
MNFDRWHFEQVLNAATIRRAMWLANANAALWAIGNGLVSTLLVIYLANDLGATGVAVGLILAAPRFAGLLRLGVPAIIRQLENRKAVCIAAYLSSVVVLLIVPAAATSHIPADSRWGIPLLVAAWCGYHLLEYIGGVALWSWLGDLTPRRIRGRLLGRREQWLVAGRVVGMAISAAITLCWPRFFPGTPRWQPLALSALGGAALMLAAVAPLAAMPAVLSAPSAVPNQPWKTLFRALVDPTYRRLLAFWFWFSIVNGLTAVAQELYPIRVLNLQYVTRMLLQGMMRTGQLTIAPQMGRLVDRYGNRPVMIVSQLIVASGLLFFLAATPQHPWLIAGVFITWIAYAGLNVGLDNIKLKLAPPDNNAPYLAVFHSTGDLANGLATVAAGFYFDQQILTGTAPLALYTQLFLLGWLGRTLVIIFLIRLVEHGAQKLRTVIR